jgi:NADH-quinone oxidoreductase subunit N
MPSYSLDTLFVIVPETVVLVIGMAVLIAAVLLPRDRRHFLAYFSIAGLAIAAIQTLRLRGLDIQAFSGMFVLDDYAIFFKMIFFIAAALAIMISSKYLKMEGVEYGEYYSLILFAVCGMMIMASGADLISIYLGLELMALSVYILAGFMRDVMRSNEAALKYFLLGAFSSGILLYGIATMYGVTGTTNLREIALFIGTGEYNPAALTLAMVLIASGFAFKVAAVPFHMWTPDVYEGAPTCVTAFMSVGPKAAGFAAFLRVFSEAFPALQPDWTMVIATLSVLSMVIGNVVALSQTNIKRMLAYSSIAHAGYALIGFVAWGTQGVSSVMLYLFLYTFMNIGAFGIVLTLRRGGERCENIEDLNGLSKRNKLAALFMLVFMFSLAGIPPTAGFIGKFYIFMAALHAGYLWLALVGVATSAISAFFYLRVVKAMYMSEPEGELEIVTSPMLKIAMVIAVGAVLYLGMYPSGILDFARNSIAGLM